MYLPDVNFWLALVFQVHIHHKHVLSWFEKVPDNSCAFCRMTQQGLLRLSTNPLIFKKECVTMAKAWEIYDRLLHDPRIFYINEPEDLVAHWKKYTIPLQYSPKVWNDAYLAAFAKNLDFIIVTLDKGFKMYEGLKCVILAD